MKVYSFQSRSVGYQVMAKTEKEAWKKARRYEVCLPGKEKFRLEKINDFKVDGLTVFQDERDNLYRASSFQEKLSL